MTGVGPDSFRPTYSASELGLSSKSLPTDTNTATVSALKSTLDTVGKDGKFTLDEIMQLKIATHMAISDPQLPPGDKAKLQAFYGTLTDAATHIFHDLSTKVTNASPEHAKALNDYMMVNCVLDLFINTNELSKLYTQMMRAESQLGQKLGLVFIQMAKDVYNATIASGELEANNLLADASLKGIEAASYGLKAGSMGLSHLGKKLGEQGALRQARQDKYAKKQELEQAKQDKLNQTNKEVKNLNHEQQLALDNHNNALPPGSPKLTKDQWVDKQVEKHNTENPTNQKTKEQWMDARGITTGPKEDSTKLTLTKKKGEEPLSPEEEAKAIGDHNAKWDLRSSLLTSGTDGMLAAAHAGTDIYKAGNVRQKAQVDATRGFSQSMMEMIKETMHKLDEDKGSMSQIMNKLWDAVAAQQRVSTEQWK